MITLLRSAGLVYFLLAAGCAGVAHTPPSEPAVTGTAPSVAVAAKPAPAAPKPDASVKVAPVTSPAAPPSSAPTGPSAAKPEASVTKPAAKAPASAEPKQPAPKKEIAAAPAPNKESATPPAPKPPPLDLAGLEKKLKETEAIGVFTKLTLKNQVDALLEQFRAYYEGRIKTTLSELRHPYDQLLMKVLSLLQDSDPPLAREITQSREAIWGILSDPNKFKNL